MSRGVAFFARIFSQYFATGFLPLLCATLLLVRRSGDRFAPWASLSLLVLSLGIGPATFWYGGNDPASLIYNVLNGVAAATLLLTLILFPDGRFTGRWTKVVALLAMAAVMFTPGASSFANVVLVAGLIASVAVIARRMKHAAASQETQQIRWVLFGFAAATVSLVLYTLAERVRETAWTVPVQIWSGLIGEMFGAAVAGLLLAGITVGLMRYRLYDADATISRSIAYGSITLSLLGIFAASEKIVEVLGEEYFGKSLGALAGVLGAAMAAICIGPIHHRVTRWAEKRFRSGLMSLRHGLPLLVGDMRETATPQTLANAMLKRVERGVRARHGAVLIDGVVLDARDIDEACVDEWLSQRSLLADGGSGLQIERDDPLFPMRVPLEADGTGLVGWLLLGSRPDGSLYGREERSALQEIADPVARGLAIAIERQGREQAQRTRDEARDAEIGRLGRVLLRLQEQLGWEMASAPAAGLGNGFERQGTTA